MCGEGLKNVGISKNVSEDRKVPPIKFKPSIVLMAILPVISLQSKAMKTTKRKHILALRSAIFILAALLLNSACTPAEEDPPSPQVAAKMVLETHDYYSEVPGSFSDAYHIQLIQYSDGSAGFKQELMMGNVMIASFEPLRDPAGLS